MNKIEVGQIWQDRLTGRKVKVQVADKDVVSLEVVAGKRPGEEQFIRYHTGNFRALFYLLPDNVEIRYRKPGSLVWKRRVVAKANELDCRELLKDGGMEVR